MLKDDLIESERHALDTIRVRCARGVGGAFSPLENIDGTNSIFDSIDALVDSPLCWPGMSTPGYEQQADTVLESLRDLYERAVQPWEQFRTLHPPLPYMRVWATTEADQDAGALPIYDRWPNGTFPAKIQREAKGRYWLLKSTSRFSASEIPNKWDLDFVSPAIAPLKFEHVAGMAVVVCIARALEQYKDTLTEWAYVAREKMSGHSFEWLTQNKPALLEKLLAEHVASSDSGYEAERASRVAALAKNAEAWLELVNTEDYHQAEIERTTGNATRKTLAKVAAEKASSARKSAKNPRSAKHLTAQMVADDFKARPGVKFQIVQGELADKYQVHESTIARRHKEAKEKNLLS